MNQILLSSARPAAPHWRRWLRQPVSRGHWRRWRRILTGVTILSAIAGLHDYIRSFSAPALVGVLALLYAPATEKQPPESFRFGWLALFFIALFFGLPVRTILYFAWGATACLLVETFHRRITATVPFILFLLTPVITYFAETFSFPIRLQLTLVAGRLIRLSGLPATVTGNAITIRDHAFSVDPACVGLHLLQISLLGALLLMNYFQSHYRRGLRGAAVFLLLIYAGLLNILANLLRIICLVVLNILPGNPWHDVFGLVFLLVYILLPLLLLIRPAIRRFGIPLSDNDMRRPARTRILLAGNIAIGATLLLLAGLSLRTEKAHPAGLTAGDHIPGYTIKEIEGSVLQLDNHRSLVYLKPIPGFYYTDHTPTFCWQGSGYEFSAIRETAIAGATVFEATIQKDNQRLYTAWWYDNGIHRTIQPFDWRWDLIRGAPAYSVINITASTPADLQNELTRVLQTNPFHPLLGRAPSPARVKIW